MSRKLISIFVLIAVLGMAVVPAFAQETSRTFTKTEAQINNSIYYSWINFWRRSAPTGHVTGVEVTEDAMSITLTR